MATGELGFESTLWQAADKLHGHLEQVIRANMRGLGSGG
jgi:hypothetical protein